jgi:hypothetical protein
MKTEEEIKQEIKTLKQELKNNPHSIFCDAIKANVTALEWVIGTEDQNISWIK